MRCPKCGYISFDQEETCANCSRSLQEFSAEIKGTGLKVEKTSFLKSAIEDSGQEATRAEDYGDGIEGDDLVLEEFDLGENLETEEEDGFEFSLDEEEIQQAVPEEFEYSDSTEGSVLETEEEYQFDTSETGLEEETAFELVSESDADITGEEDSHPPEEPDFKLQLESDIMEEEPDEAGLEYDLENIDMSDLLIEGEENEEDEDEVERKKDGHSSADLPDIEL
ncbi:MAG: hypothetical protein ACQES8_07955 [Thermodesulfobacteriota bacterium]